MKQTNMYSCNKCPASFKHKKDLIRHEKTHSDEKFTCTICNVSFHRKDVLKRHTINRHKTEEQNRHKTEDQHFKCTKCKKVFKHKRSLKTRENKR